MSVNIRVTSKVAIIVFLMDNPHRQVHRDSQWKHWHLYLKHFKRRKHWFVLYSLVNYLLGKGIRFKYCCTIFLLTTAQSSCTKHSQIIGKKNKAPPPFLPARMHRSIARVSERQCTMNHSHFCSSWFLVKPVKTLSQLNICQFLHRVPYQSQVNTWLMLQTQKSA